MLFISSMCVVGELVRPQSPGNILISRPAFPSGEQRRDSFVQQFHCPVLELDYKHRHCFATSMFYIGRVFKANVGFPSVPPLFPSVSIRRGAPHRWRCRGKAGGYFTADSNKHILLCLIVKILPETLICKAQPSKLQAEPISPDISGAEQIRSTHMCLGVGVSALVVSQCLSRLPALIRAEDFTGRWRKGPGCRLPSLCTTWTAWSEVQRSPGWCLRALDHTNRSSGLLSPPTAFIFIWIYSVSACCFLMPLIRQDRSTFHALGQKS